MNIPSVSNSLRFTELKPSRAVVTEWEMIIDPGDNQYHVIVEAMGNHGYLICVTPNKYHSNIPIPKSTTKYKDKVEEIIQKLISNHKHEVAVSYSK